MFSLGGVTTGAAGIAAALAVPVAGSLTTKGVGTAVDTGDGAAGAGAASAETAGVAEGGAAPAVPAFAAEPVAVLAAAIVLTPAAACAAAGAVAPGEAEAIGFALADVGPVFALPDVAGAFDVGLGVAGVGARCIACRIWAKSSLRGLGLLADDAACDDESARAKSARSVRVESPVESERAVGGRDGGAAGRAGTANMGCDLNGANRASALR
jgi:hypothetical protein